PHGLVLRTDRLKTDRVLSSLLDNAIKFTHRGAVRLECLATSEGVVIRVSDTGEGIAPEDQDRIFDEFVQVKNSERDSRKGYGLGLAIARRLARQLGGQLTVESEPGRGSRFALVLPASVLPARGAEDGDGRGDGPVADPRPAAPALG